MDKVIKSIMAMIEDNQRLEEAGVIRNDPSTWRPDLVRPLSEIHKNER